VKRQFLIFLSGWLASFSASFGNVVTPREVTCTQDTLLRLRQALHHYHVEYSKLPTGTPSTVIAALTGDNSNGLNPLKIVFFEFRAGRARSRFWRDDAVPADRGPDGIPIDWWGRHIVLSIDPTGRQATLRSLGRNGRDDAGKPDDIVSTYEPKQ
jgi:hypothetical protein